MTTSEMIAEFKDSHERAAVFGGVWHNSESPWQMGYEVEFRIMPSRPSRMLSPVFAEVVGLGWGIDQEAAIKATYENWGVRKVQFS